VLSFWSSLEKWQDCCQRIWQRGDANVSNSLSANINKWRCDTERVKLNSQVPT